MLRRMRQRLASAGTWIVGIAWFVGATVIATDVFGVEAQRRNLWVVMLIFLAPAVAMVVGGELLHRVRNGPQGPGRHSRADADDAGSGP